MKKLVACLFIVSVSLYGSNNRYEGLGREMTTTTGDRYTTNISGNLVSLQGRIPSFDSCQIVYDNKQEDGSKNLRIEIDRNGQALATTTRVFLPCSKGEVDEGTWLKRTVKEMAAIVVTYIVKLQETNNELNKAQVHNEQLMQNGFERIGIMIDLDERNKDLFITAVREMKNRSMQENFISTLKSENESLKKQLEQLSKKYSSESILEDALTEFFK